MVKFFGGRAAAAIIGLFMLAIGSSAAAQDLAALNVPAAVKALDVDSGARTLGTAVSVRPAVAATTAVASTNGTVVQAQPARSVTVKLATSIATEAAWLYKGGWPLYALVGKYSAAHRSTSRPTASLPRSISKPAAKASRASSRWLASS